MNLASLVPRKTHLTTNHSVQGDLDLEIKADFQKMSMSVFSSPTFARMVDVGIQLVRSCAPVTRVMPWMTTEPIALI